MVRLRGMVLALLLLPAVSVGSQIPGLLSGKKPPAQTAPADSLGRDNPHDAVMGFIRAAQDENYSVAAQYFQPPPGHRPLGTTEEQDLAVQLLAVINQKILPYALDSLSRDPQGKLDDGLPPNRELLSGVGESSGTIAIELLRLGDDHDHKIWLISRKTLDTIPEIYDSLQFSDIEKSLPAILTKHRILSMPPWQWLAIIVAIPLAVLLAWGFSIASRLILHIYRERRDFHIAHVESLYHLGPGTLLFSAMIHYVFVFFIGASIVYRQYYRRVLFIILAIAFYWLMARSTKWLADRIVLRLTSSGRMAERSIVSLARRVLEVLIFIAVALATLAGLGVNVTAALAGLGIGGLAIGLGAQKTFENLIGGISVLTDKALQVGDACRIGDQRGIVEDIGLRSTKLRTEDRTVVTIPNGTVATAVLENFRQRDKILFRQSIRLRYDLSSDHLRYLLEEIRSVLKENSHVEDSSSRVRLLRFADWAIEIEIYAYVLVRDFTEFLELQEELLLSLLESIEKTGAAIALPSQATLVTQDAWVDPEKAKAAKSRGGRVSGPGGTDGKLPSR